ncbi:MAG: cupin domain-containing protein [Leptonema sp. (in: bacteria)]|jgi:cupin superfamily acireductone dioxygenase involved in methionine salvage
MENKKVKVYKWPYKEIPTEEKVKKEMEKYGFKVYDLQTVPGWFERSRHSHDYDEIRGAVEGVITFHFDDGPVTIEAGDILIIPGGIPHEVKVHNPNLFKAFKGSITGERKVTEYENGKGSMEELKQKGQYEGLIQ